VGVEPALVKGGNGVFDVVADGTLVFSKYRDARFPDAAEIVATLKSLKG
jgi:predicted Rdx family selenoprotein